MFNAVHERGPTFPALVRPTSDGHGIDAERDLPAMKPTVDCRGVGEIGAKSESASIHGGAAIIHVDEPSRRSSIVDVPHCESNSGATHPWMTGFLLQLHSRRS